MARHIRWARSRRTHSAFTTWQGTSGSGPRTATTTATRAFPPTGARTRPLRATPRRRTAKAIASELIAAARGCFRRGCCDRPPENAILPTSALTSWVSASLERFREAEVQRAAQVRLELLFVSGGGEHRHHDRAAVFQLQTGPIPHSTPDVLDGGLEKRRQKRIAWCGRLTACFRKHPL